MLDVHITIPEVDDKKSSGGNNDITDFLLKEYENIAKAFFNAQEVMSRWIKYYLIIMAVPFSFIAFIYRDKPEKFELFNMADTLSILFSLLGIVGTLLGFIIIESGTESILYARTVNGIRKYFCESAPGFSKSRYLVLPVDTKKPSYLGFGDLLWITIITGLINSFYLALGFTQISFLRTIYLPSMSQKVLSLGILVIFFLLHFLYYLYASDRKERKYGCHENTSC